LFIAALQGRQTGVILAILGAMGRAVGGRKHCY
jgi:hypothetical protein